LTTCQSFNGCQDQPRIPVTANGDAFKQLVKKKDVSQVTDMTEAFAGLDIFDKPLDCWDVAQVTSMRNMFAGASSFNKPIGL
jgi:hypothetical protein